MLRIHPQDLIANEPTQAVVNSFVLEVPGGISIKEALWQPGLFLPAQRRLRAGDTITLLRFSDATRQRLIERAIVAIVESLPHAVTFALSGKIETMPAPSKRDERPREERLTVDTVPHGFQVVEDTEDQNKIAFWKVTDGDGHTLETFKGGEEGRTAAQQFLEWNLKSSPDFSERYRTKQEAEQFRAEELKRRRAAVGPEGGSN